MHAGVDAGVKEYVHGGVNRGGCVHAGGTGGVAEMPGVSGS